MIDDDAACLRVFMAEEGGGIDDGDVGAEHAVGLGDLHADGAAAEHDQMLDPLVHVEDRLVGEIAHLVEAGDRRDHRRGAGGHHEAAGANEIVPGLDRGLVEEARACLDDADAETGEALDGIVGRDRRDHAMHVIVHAGMVDLSLDDVDAEGAGRAHGLGALAGGEQSLGGHAAVIEAVAAHAALLDEHDRNAELSRRGSHREAPRPCADHAEVRLQHLFHVSPSSPWASALHLLAPETLDRNRDQRNEPKRHKARNQPGGEQGPGLKHERA